MAEELSEITQLKVLRDLMLEHGAKSLFFKRLAPNDNSKNQIYLGGDYTALNILPYGEVTADVSVKDSKRDRFKADLSFVWLDGSNAIFNAPSSQLILYPKYPEVRLSGFLQGANRRPSKYLASRDAGRVLFFGITRIGKIIAHVIGRNNPIQSEIADLTPEDGKGVFVEVPLSTAKVNTQDILLKTLLNVHEKGWIDSVKLGSDGIPKPYAARNGGGYTLEAELGIVPNGFNEPDFMGWEIKQHKSPHLDKPLMGGAITLMTPEPTGGFYKIKGAAEFVRRFGYPDKSGKPDRLNFGGVHKFGAVQKLTGLKLTLTGYDVACSKITNINGGIVLVSSDGTEAAVWYYKTLIEKWTRKHAKAAIVPSNSRVHNGLPQYHYGNVIGLGRKSSITHFLDALAASSVYYDPGIKLENATGPKAKVKPRSQFRIRPKMIPSLYEGFELKTLTK
mgnify:CR=1 FL=1